jgi:hypothetical protein
MGFGSPNVRSPSVWEAGVDVQCRKPSPSAAPLDALLSLARQMYGAIATLEASARATSESPLGLADEEWALLQDAMAPHAATSRTERLTRVAESIDNLERLLVWSVARAVMRYETLTTRLAFPAEHPPARHSPGGTASRHASRPDRRRGC